MGTGDILGRAHPIEEPPMTEEHAHAPNSHVPAPRTARTALHRKPDRAVPDRIEEFLRAGMVAHIAYVENGEPRVIPFLFLYDFGHLYVHGSPASATMRAIGDGRPVTVSVAMLDGLVASRTETNHTANYRSVVAYGRGHRVSDPERKRRVMRAMLERYFAGRQTPQDYAPAGDDDLVRMELVAIEIEEAQAKMREGDPTGPDDSDPNRPGSAFVRTV
jgi:nitroimidazol reductase NimA-like FMN-containing flavoprotein (pyridoxamine 5'-phosphate oxidase superfamily)